MTLRRVLIWTSAALVAVLLMVAAAAYWASRSETVLRWGIDRFAPLLPCALTVEGLQDGLMKPVRVEYLACETADYHVEARTIALAWSAWPLAACRLDISSLSIEALHFTSKIDQAQAAPAPPPKIPEELELPLVIDAHSIEIATLVTKRCERATELRALDVAYHADNRDHRLTLHNLEHHWGRIAGEPIIGTTAPFPLTAQFTAATDRVEGRPLTADIALTGQLQNISASINAYVGEQRASATFELAPFDPEPVKSLKARASGVDVATFDRRLPHTGLAITLDAMSAGTSALTGQLNAENAIAGKLDQQQLPIRSLDTRFELDPISLQLSDLQLDLGVAGTARGVARFTLDHMNLRLEVTDLDLRAVRRDLRETRLNGIVAAEQRGELELATFDLRQTDLQFEGKAEITEQRVLIERLIARSGAAQLRASATLERDERLGFTLDSTLSRFDPSRFGDFPQADVNARIQVRGNLRPEWRNAVNYELDRSQLAGVALAGRGRFELSPTQLQNADVQLDYGANQLKLTGSFGNRNDTLSFTLDAKRLDQFDKTLSGNVQASGTLGGTVKQPAIKADLNGQQITVAGVGVDKAQARLQVERADDPVIRAQARLQRVKRGEHMLDSAAVDVDGTLGKHAIALAATAPDVNLTGRFNGGWDKTRSVWSGTIAQLDNKGEYPFMVKRAATLELGQKHVVIGATDIEFSQTEIKLGETRYQDGALLTQGNISGVSLARVLALMQKPPEVESTLVLGARWEIRTNDTVNGFIELSRSSGDIAIAAEERLALGLDELRVTLRAAASTLSAEAVVRGALSDAQGSAQTRLEKRDVKWGVPGTAPLTLAGDMNMQSIRPLAALASREVTADGQVRLAVNASGTIAEPQLRGNVEGNKLKIEHVANGVFLDEGILRASFADDALNLSEFRIKAGEGELTARGDFLARKGAPTLDLEESAQKLAVIQHPELRLTVSGAGKLGYRDATVSLAGELTADQGRVELRRRTFPSLGDDVVVTGRETRSHLSAETRRANLDLTLDLGPDFTIVGRGLDARMAGRIRLTSSVDKPRSGDGEIRVASGTFEAYGRRLQIEEGLIYFAGPVNNPGLSIRAMRKNQPVEAGVEVSGTARDPLVCVWFPTLRYRTPTNWPGWYWVARPNTTTHRITARCKVRRPRWPPVWARHRSSNNWRVPSGSTRSVLSPAPTKPKAVWSQWINNCPNASTSRRRSAPPRRRIRCGSVIN